MRITEIYKQADITTSDGIQKLNVDLKRRCVEYYQKQIIPTMTYEDVKVLLDRTFNLWDSFINKMLRGDLRMIIIGGLFRKYGFKETFLENKELAEIYYRGSL